MYWYCIRLFINVFCVIIASRDWLFALGLTVMLISDAALTYQEYKDYYKDYYKSTNSTMNGQN